MTDAPALADLTTVADFERAARERLPETMFNTILGGHGATYWQTNTNNIDALARVGLRPRVLTGVAERNLSTTVLGTEIAMPIIAAPSGSHQRVHPDGELATARGTAAVGTVMGMSTVANFSIEEVAEAASGPKWFQSYVFRDKGLTTDLIQRAEAADFKAIIITVDNISGALDRDTRQRHYGYSWETEAKHSAFLDPERILKNLQPYEASDNELTQGQERFQRQSLKQYFDPTLSWKDLAWIRDASSLPLIVKGIQTAEDAALAVEHGADAIVVSNHGGTTSEVDGLPGSITLMPEIIDAVDGRIEVYFDGGIRTGKDVLKALALGARAVLLGRAVQFGLAAGGAEGVEKVFRRLGDELNTVMGLCGIADVREVPRATVGAV